MKHRLNTDKEGWQEAKEGQATDLPDNTIWHLGHSSNAIKIAGTLMLFDYVAPFNRTREERGLHEGHIVPAEIQNETVVVFVSHGHEDHFSPDIFSWQQTIRNITYVVSYDIKNCPDEAIHVKPNQHLELNGFSVRAYPSTDEGVAFSIWTAGRHIYFSGDNAFWNWDGDLDDDIYIRQALSPIDTSTPVDIAFQVCDPRLEEMGAGGLYVFARHLNPNLLIPIHSFGDYAFNQRAARELRKRGFAKRFWCIKGVGETFRFA